MFGGQDVDVGRAYLGTQQAMGQICGENRPILWMFLPFFCFLQLPSASAIFRQLPFRVASGPCGRWQHVWGPWSSCRGIISRYPTGRGPNLWGNRPILMLFRPFPCFRRCVLEYRIRDSSVPARKFRTIRCSIGLRVVIFAISIRCYRGRATL